MKKKRFILFLIFIFIIIPFLINTYSILRLISVFIGILLLFFIPKKLVLSLFFTFLTLIISYSIDLILVEYASRIPIFSIKIVTNATLKTYNSIFYRLYNCDNILVLDNFYKKDYACTMEPNETDINSFLSNIDNDFKEYKNKFININGKVSGIEGSSKITMQAYEAGKTSLNGEVTFSDNIILEITNNEGFKNTENIKIYDTINVVGRIKSITTKDGVRIVSLVDSKIVHQSDYDTFKVNVVNNKRCESDLKLLSKTEDINYYTTCLESIYIEYNEDNKYDLGYVLTDKRMNFDLLNKDITPTENEDVILYQHDDFHVIKCKNSNNVIIGDKTLNLKTTYCETFDVIEVIDPEGGV